MLQSLILRVSRGGTKLCDIAVGEKLFMLVNLVIAYECLYGNSAKGGGCREIYEGLIFTEGLMVARQVLHEIDEQFNWDETELFTYHHRVLWIDGCDEKKNIFLWHAVSVCSHLF